MRKLALPDEVLLSVQKPARYLGNEANAVYKDRAQVDIRFAMCFPEVYEVGMSHLGIQILYDMFNRREDTWCERVYSPWLDLDKILRERKIPLFALESQDPVRDFDFLGITLQFHERAAGAGFVRHTAESGGSRARSAVARCGGFTCGA